MVAQHLLQAGMLVRALTRNPDKPAARTLADRGAEVVAGDLGDMDSVRSALAGVSSVFCAPRLPLLPAQLTSPDSSAFPSRHPLLAAAIMFRRSAGDEPASPPPASYDALVAQQDQGAAQGVPADAEFQGHRCLGRQPVPGGRPARSDPGADHRCCLITQLLGRVGIDHDRHRSPMSGLSTYRICMPWLTRLARHV